MKDKNKKFIIPFPTVVFFILLFHLSRSVFTLLTLICAFLHELGHLFCARLFGIDVERITIYPFGADIRLARSLRSYRCDLCVALLGPLVNLSLALIFLRLTLIPELVFINLSLSIMNLLPIKGLDGGRILYSFLMLHCKTDACDKALLISSFVFIFFLWSISAIALLRGDGDPSLFVISCFLFASSFLNEKG